MRLVIAPKGDKGRSFSANLLAHAHANTLWENGTSGDCHRPVWMVVGGTEQEMKAFNANLLTGKKAEISSDHGYRQRGEKFEILKSAGYMHHSCKIGGGMVTTFYLPDLLRLDPGMVDPAGVKFVVIPALAWVSAQRFDLAAARLRLQSLGAEGKVTDEALHVALAEGSLLLAYLDRRCRFPIPFSPVFGAWLLQAMETARALFRTSHQYDRGRYRIDGESHVNALPGYAVQATHEQLGEILSAEVRRWHGTGAF